MGKEKGKHSGKHKTPRGKTQNKSGANKQGSQSPKSPKTKSEDSGYSFVREKLIPINPLPPITVTPYPLSNSTEMTMAMSAEAQTLQEKMKELRDQIQKTQALRDSHLPTLQATDNLSNKIIADGKLTPAARSKLKVYSDKVAADAGAEMEEIKKCLQIVYEAKKIRQDVRTQAKNSGNKETIRRGMLMKMLLNLAETLPLWFGKRGEHPPPLCGAIQPDPNYVGKPGDMVAALVKGAEGEDNWILAEIKSHNPSTNKYDVDDIDEEQKERHSLSKRRVYPLPLMRANPQLNPDALYKKGSTVMALYPQTTCFYKAIINRVPRLANEEYEVLFEDSSYSEGFSPPLGVPQRYVIQLRDNAERK